ncbi:MAG: hypothetical protein ACYCO9_13395 [Streptosporangiaceae bacterium]
MRDQAPAGRLSPASLSNVGNRLAENGRSGEFEDVLGGALARFGGIPLGAGHIRLVRGRWLRYAAELARASRTCWPQ